MTVKDEDNPTGKPVPVPNPPAATLVKSEQSREAILSWLHAEDIGDEDTDNEEIAIAEAYRILNAQTPTEALSNPGLVTGEDLVGKTFTVLSIAWRRSTKSKTPSRYAVMECVNENGEPFLAQCGATDVILKLKRAESADPPWLPWTVSMESQATQSGNTMLRLTVPSEAF